MGVNVHIVNLLAVTLFEKMAKIGSKKSVTDGSEGLPLRPESPKSVKNRLHF